MNGFTLRKKDGQEWLVCEPFEQAGFITAFSTKKNGNLHYRSFPAAELTKNKQEFLKALGAPYPVRTGHQVHGDAAEHVRQPQDLDGTPDCDALVSALGGVFLGVRTADCLPILLADPRSGWLAAVHAGWKGTLVGIAGKVVRVLAYKAGGAQNLIAALGPAACGACYEIGPEVKAKFSKKFKNVDSFIAIRNTKLFLDNAAANKRQLVDAGLKPENIFSTEYCTMHHNNLFFSHRVEGKENPETVGRMLSVIARSEATRQSH